jgi:hypothetical protein
MASNESVRVMHTFYAKTEVLLQFEKDQIYIVTNSRSLNVLYKQTKSITMSLGIDSTNVGSQLCLNCSSFLYNSATV